MMRNTPARAKQTRYFLIVAAVIFWVFIFKQMSVPNSEGIPTSSSSSASSPSSSTSSSATDSKPSSSIASAFKDAKAAALEDQKNRWKAKCAGEVKKTSGAGKVALVTGAAGFIASHVARHCAVLGMKVIAIDDMSGGFMSNVPVHDNVIFVRGDVKDAEFVEGLFKAHKIDYVYHLAAYAAEGLSHFIRSYNYRNNLVGSVELLNAAVKHKVKCFVFTSSIAVYGAGQTPMIEELTPEPEDPYGISKYAIEMDLKAAKVMWDMDYMIFRPHNVYGPHQNLFDKYRNAIGIFINQVLSGKPITIFGDGEQTRAFSYIDDVAPIIAQGPLVKAAYNEVFNIGADTPYTLNTLADEVAQALEVDLNKVHLPERHEVKHAHSSHAKVQCFFKPPVATDLHSGLRKMVDWQKKEGKLMVPVEFAALEVKENLPPSWDREDLAERAAIVHDGRSEAPIVALLLSGPDSMAERRNIRKRFRHANTKKISAAVQFVVSVNEVSESERTTLEKERIKHDDMLLVDCEGSCALLAAFQKLHSHYIAHHVVLAKADSFINIPELIHAHSTLPKHRTILGAKEDSKADDKLDFVEHAKRVFAALPWNEGYIMTYDIVEYLARKQNAAMLKKRSSEHDDQALAFWLSPLKIDMLTDDRLQRDGECQKSSFLALDVPVSNWSKCL